MAGAMDFELAAAVSEAGGLGSLPAAMLTPDQLRDQVAKFRSRTVKPLNVNFFCHAPPTPDPAREARWRERLMPYYREFGLDAAAAPPFAVRAPFDGAFCSVVEETRPEVVSFHFGLPSRELVARVKAAGAVVLSSATTVAEARWLAEHGVDAVIAQGLEAGGHRGMFLIENIAGQVGALALIPQVVDAVDLPVIAAGGIADVRGIVATLALGAAGVQLGTAYLHCPEAKISAPHREALANACADATALTNLISGRPARGIVNRLMHEVGPISDIAPEFPLASGALAPLRAAAEARGLGDFSPLWAGQAAALGRALPAGELTRRLATETLELLRALSGSTAAPARSS